MGFEVSLTGAESGEAYRAKTSDIQVVFKGVDEAKIDIGISQKRTRQSANAKAVLAKVKTTTLDSLLSAS
jgi:hypothetical protein